MPETDRSRRAPAQSGSRAPANARPSPQPAPPALPVQKPITDDEPAPAAPKRWVKILRRVGATALVVAALALGYVFLLLGEPSKEASVEATPGPEEVIRTPMNGVEARSNEEIPALAVRFAKPVLTVQSDLPLQRAALYDTAFSGGYARKVTFEYSFPDGQLLVAESIRPVAAATLLGGDGYSLSVSQRYTMAGLDAVRMDSGSAICVFAKGEGAVYAVTCPKSHQDDLPQLLKNTLLMMPVSQN